MNEITTVEDFWRSQIAGCCGGAKFDAPGGSYAFSNILQKERELSAANAAGDPTSALLALSIADPTGKMDERAMDALMRYYKESPDATRYTDNTGIPGTHETILEFLNARYGIQLTLDNIQYSPGSIKRALSEYMPTLFFQPGITKLVFPTPGYPVIKDPKNLRGAIAIDIPLAFDQGKWSIDLEEIERYFRDMSLGLSGTVIYVNVPHNPTGSGYSAEQWQTLLAWAKENKVILVVDEAYTDLRYDTQTVSVLTVPGWEECCVVLQSVSKGWSATGLRFGWMVGNPTVIKALRLVTDVKDSGMFGPGIAAGLECLRHPEWADETKGQYQVLHQALYDGIKSTGFSTSMPEAGLCQFTPAPKAANGVEFSDALGCAQWFRERLRISLMHYEVSGKPWLRWAITLKPIDNCGLLDEAAVIAEVVRRLQETEFTF